MTDAVNAPVRRARRETHTGDFAIPQPPGASLDLDDDLEHESAILPVDDASLMKDYTEALAFGEQPVTILINKNSEKFAPKTVDCWVNGKGCEVVINGRWVETGWMPVALPVTTKRKYVEVLARSRPEAVTTDVGEATVEFPHNDVVRSTSLKHQFSVLKDGSPMGGEWFMRLMAER